jgi:hypothetical protein
MHDGAGIETDFDCLEKRGIVTPSKYDELGSMFQIIDIRAVEIINKTAADIAIIEKERKGT